MRVKFVFISGVRDLLSSDAMRDFSRARVYLDKNYKSQEHFTVSRITSSVIQTLALTKLHRDILSASLSVLFSDHTGASF